ncbi:MAG: formate hydrogenlyase maturation HycH family protein [Acetobacteraceae bacterium]|nr:formate hydrogenlyase maturation HycH family protein [Acetobacteraceae bacterium]
MKEGVVFYQLNAKFLERTEDIPENAKQVVYYSLAIGHHIGVFDCFKPILRCSNALYDQIVATFPEGSEARRKLTGLLRFGEIVVDSSHTRMLKVAIDEVLASADAEVAVWLRALDTALDAIEQEPVMYLMGKRMA